MSVAPDNQYQQVNNDVQMARARGYDGPGYDGPGQMGYDGVGLGPGQMGYDGSGYDGPGLSGLGSKLLSPWNMLFVVLFVVLAIVTAIAEHSMTNWKCDPSALPSKYGPEYVPRTFTLDESASGAMNYIGGRSVNVFAGAEQRERVVGEPMLGSFRKVWVWWGRKFGYVEQTSNGNVLRFTATQAHPWFHTKWIVESCDVTQNGLAEAPVYHIARQGSIFGSFDGTFHNIWHNNVKIASADHQTNGLDVHAGLFSGVDLNLKWNIVFKSIGQQPTVLAMAYQWYNQNNMLVNYGTSNWAVAAKNQSVLPPGVAPLPAHIVAYTAALYDLNTGSDRRRRSSSGGYDSRRRRHHFR